MRREGRLYGRRKLSAGGGVGRLNVVHNDGIVDACLNGRKDLRHPKIVDPGTMAWLQHQRLQELNAKIAAGPRDSVTTVNE